MTFALERQLRSPVVPFGRAVRRRREVGRPDLEPLSVFLDAGVVPRASRDDNFNRLGADLSSYLVVEPGDVVFNKLRTWQGGLGVSRYRGIVSPAYFVCSPSDAFEPRFLHYLLRSAPYLAELSRVSKFMPPSQFDILWDDLRLVPVPALALTTQRAIADFLDTETARIDAVVRTKSELTQLLLTRWLVDLCTTMLPGGLDSATGRPTESRWASRPFRRLLAQSWGGDWGDEPGESDAELPCVRAADFDFARLRATTGASRSFTRASASTRGLHPGDLVIEKSGGGEGVPVGRVVAWRGEGQAVPTNFAGGLRPATDVDPDFVLLTFRAAYEVGLPWRSIKQTTGLQNLDLGHYLTHRWPVPSLPDQRNIASELLTELHRVLHIQTTLRHQVGLLQEHRQALITAAVTGELQVPGVAA